MKNPGKDRPQEPTAETQTEPSALSDDLGLTLTELSETYAALLGDGNDPYVPVPESPAVVGRSANEAP